jgi:hypothetical protein
MAGEGKNQESYFLALFQECQEYSNGRFNCKNCIVPLDLCKKWLEEPQED